MQIKDDTDIKFSNEFLMRSRVYIPAGHRADCHDVVCRDEATHNAAQCNAMQHSTS